MSELTIILNMLALFVGLFGAIACVLFRVFAYVRLDERLDQLRKAR